MGGGQGGTSSATRRELSTMLETDVLCALTVGMDMELWFGLGTCINDVELALTACNSFIGALEQGISYLEVAPGSPKALGAQFLRLVLDVPTVDAGAYSAVSHKTLPLP